MEYTIRELAGLAGVSTRTLRWYDRQGLLKPHRIGENGYRYYTSAEADRLQHILFYRALGVELAQIRTLLDDPSFDRMTALRDHLTALERERTRIEALIRTVRHTIQAEERNEPLMDSEKFEAFKRDAVAANEQSYGPEIRARYGDEAVNSANQKLLNMSPAMPSGNPSNRKSSPASKPPCVPASLRTATKAAPSPTSTSAGSPSPSPTAPAKSNPP